MPRMPWIAALCAALLLSLPASGTAVKKLTEAELISAAKLIGHVECVSTSPEWCAEGRRIFTRVRFSVRSMLKGDPELRDIEVLLPGGERDGMSYAIHGMPRFEPGEEVVLFLTAEHPKSGICLPVGLGQGLYRIRRQAGKEPEALRDTRDLLLVEERAEQRGERGDKQTRSGQAGALERVGLEQLLSEVRAEVKKQQAAKDKLEKLKAGTPR